jgi:hypothetical protein
VRASLLAISAILVDLCSIASPAAVAQEPKNANPYAAVTDKLLSLTSTPLSDCRSHADVSHPENASVVDDSGWTHVALGAKFQSGVQVLRCHFKVPHDLNGYELRGASLKVRF